MRKPLKIALSAAAAAGLLALPGTLAPSASAASTASTAKSAASAASSRSTSTAASSATLLALTLNSGYCEPLARRFLCDVSYSGGVAPIAIRWYLNGTNVPAFNDRTFVSIGCQPTFAYDILAVVSDATGASVQYHTTPICRSGNP